ncbi:MAG: methionyl-tRNA formyltransferase, partial [Verrucomicrobia bacterium]|nr:methionyl-tRNA formyltransferase [Verrucomicrobiota bacterium]
MKIVFFGTSTFSVGILEHLASLEHSIEAIVTRPDRPRGRDLRLQPCPVKEFAVRSLPNIPIFQPEKASTDLFCEELKKLNPDLFLVVAYGEIIKTNLLSIPLKGCVNIHTSLLPEYRGAAPIQRCIMDGKKASGVTFMEMALKMDAGDILKQEIIPIPSDMSALELEEALLSKAKDALPEFLSNFDAYYAKKRPQDETKVTFAAKITPEDCVIDWSRSVTSIHDQIRALSPFPGTFVKLRFGSDVKRLKILSSKIHKQPVEGSGDLLVDRACMKISCQDGFLEPLLVQLEGKKVMK